MTDINEAAGSGLDNCHNSSNHSSSGPETAQTELPTSSADPLRRAGAPRKNGYKSILTLERVCFVVAAYNQFKEKGEKHSGAIVETVLYLRHTQPHIPISETEVRRILSNWRSTQRSTALIVSTPDPSNCTVTLPNGRSFKRLLDASFGPRSVFARTNAVANPQKRLKQNTPSVEVKINARIAPQEFSENNYLDPNIAS